MSLEYLDSPVIYLVIPLVLVIALVYQHIFFTRKLRKVSELATTSYKLNSSLHLHDLVKNIKRIILKHVKNVQLELLLLDRQRNLLKWLREDHETPIPLKEDGIFISSFLTKETVTAKTETLSSVQDREIAETLNLKDFTLFPLSLSNITYYSEDLGKIAYRCLGKEKCFVSNEKNLYLRYMECRQCDAFSAVGIIAIQSSKGKLNKSDLLKIKRIIEQPSVSLALSRCTQYEWLKSLVTKDELTGAINYRGLVENLNKEIARARRENSVIGILFIDIDNFKEFNKSKGHLAGNILLRRIAESITKHTREVDYVCRFGGDEFVVILPGTDKIGCLVTASRIRKDIEAEVQDVRCTVSIGISIFPEDGTSIEELLAVADKSMRTAKSSGKNRIIL